MNKAISIFIPTFVVVMIFNQMFYGACFKAYCLSAAFPKVTILALAISIFIYYITKQEYTSNEQEEDLNFESKINPIQEEDAITSHPVHVSAHTTKQEQRKSYSVDEVREEHKNAYKAWSKYDDEDLMRLYSEGMSINDLCKEFGRHRGGIR